MAKRFFKVRSCIASVLCIASLSAVSAQAFSDVSPNAYYKTAVDWAASEGITSGSDKDRFSPDKLCSRAQTVTFLWRANGSPTDRCSAGGLFLSGGAVGRAERRHIRHLGN